MPQGPGKYDAACTLVRDLTEAEGIILVVLRGTLGDGFSCQFVNPVDSLLLPRILREIAEQIERTQIESRH